MPDIKDFERALLHFDDNVSPSKFRGGKPIKGRPGQNFKSVAGGFCYVFPIEFDEYINSEKKITQKKAALRCWTANTIIAEREKRYDELSSYLEQNNLPYFVNEYKYYSEGITLNLENDDGSKTKKPFPIVYMDWVFGERLNIFLNNCVEKKDCKKIASIASKFKEMVTHLHKKGISHGDLSDGNILVVDSDLELGLKLVDYDTLYIPTFSQKYSNDTTGLSSYQHPMRVNGGKVDEEKLDYFSELVIYLSLLFYAEKPEKWEGKDKQLLFEDKDFISPSTSQNFIMLKKYKPESEIFRLTSVLEEYCNETDLNKIKPLEAIEEDNFHRWFSMPKKTNEDLANESFNVGMEKHNNKKYAEAIDSFSNAIDWIDSKSDFFEMRGLCYYLTSQYSLAIRDFDKAISLNPNNYLSFWHRGVVYARQGDKSKAVGDFTLGIKKSPGNYLCYEYRADIYKEQGRYTEAIEDYKKALQNNSGDKQYTQRKLDECVRNTKPTITIKTGDIASGNLLSWWKGIDIGWKWFISNTALLFMMHFVFPQGANTFIWGLVLGVGQGLILKSEISIFRNWFIANVIGGFFLLILYSNLTPFLNVFQKNFPLYLIIINSLIGLCYGIPQSIALSIHRINGRNIKGGGWWVIVSILGYCGTSILYYYMPDLIISTGIIFALIYSSITGFAINRLSFVLPPYTPYGPSIDFGEMVRKGIGYGIAGGITGAAFGGLAGLVGWGIQMQYANNPNAMIAGGIEGVILGVLLALAIPGAWWIGLMTAPLLVWVVGRNPFFGVYIMCGLSLILLLKVATSIIRSISKKTIKNVGFSKALGYYIALLPVYGFGTYLVMQSSLYGAPISSSLWLGLAGSGVGLLAGVTDAVKN